MDIAKSQESSSAKVISTVFLKVPVNPEYLLKVRNQARRIELGHSISLSVTLLDHRQVSKKLTIHVNLLNKTYRFLHYHIVRERIQNLKKMKT
jgi:hypothetical protein